jgi:hypothetical protein
LSTVLLVHGVLPAQPGPVQLAAFVIGPAAVLWSAVTANVSGTLCPAGTPAPINHVTVVAVADAVQVTPVGAVPHASEARVVPAGIVSVTVTGPLDTELPVFFAITV